MKEYLALIPMFPSHSRYRRPQPVGTRQMAFSIPLATKIETCRHRDKAFSTNYSSYTSLSFNDPHRNLHCATEMETFLKHVKNFCYISLVYATLITSMLTDHFGVVDIPFLLESRSGECFETTRDRRG